MNCRTRQTGIVLIQSLVFVLIMTFIGLAAVRNASLEQRVADNLQTSAETFRAVENCMAKRLIVSDNPLTATCGEETPIDCDKLTSTQAANHRCCFRGSSPFLEETSDSLALTRWSYEVNSNGCADDPDFAARIGDNAPLHRVGFSTIRP